ncbi:hypothetical protein AVEN_92987-1 [Araneus ventricosus]|uniref:Uncharacterized protein n=1 Tax=Araneus ventricosus TaxID=182803 RepID=A0A4Y2JMB6_ARAVE|nr:hypothetical protein AVEN_92987-1 [Araneus ventricosus]
MQEEECEKWTSIDEDIPVAATLTDLEICQAIKVDSDVNECVEENLPMNAEMTLLAQDAERYSCDTFKMLCAFRIS